MAKQVKYALGSKVINHKDLVVVNVPNEAMGSQKDCTKNGIWRPPV